MKNVTAAHIHFGHDDENGKVVVTLLKTENPPGLEMETLGGNFTEDNVQDHWRVCHLINLSVLWEMEVPYVNVHSTEFPLGEIRGQINELDVDEEEDDEEEG